MDFRKPLFLPLWNSLSLMLGKYNPRQKDTRAVERDVTKQETWSSCRSRPPWRGPEPNLGPSRASIPPNVVLAICALIGPHLPDLSRVDVEEAVRHAGPEVTRVDTADRFLQV